MPDSTHSAQSFFSGSRDRDEGDVFFNFVIKTSIIKTIQILHVTDTVIEITTKKHFNVQNKQSLPVLLFSLSL